MNLINCVVTEVTSKPHEVYGRWVVDVLADSYGRIQPTHVFCLTKEAADAVKVGSEFLA